MAHSDEIQDLAQFYREMSDQCWATAHKWRFARKQRDVIERRKWTDRAAMAGLIASDLSRLAATEGGA